MEWPEDIIRPIVKDNSASRCGQRNIWDPDLFSGVIFFLDPKRRKNNIKDGRRFAGRNK
jgi:hypothetical protein